MNDLEKLNSSITGEADKILNNCGLSGILRNYGNVLPTGSYVLGLMTWRDLDIYIENDKLTERDFFKMGGEIASRLKPQRMHFRNELLAKTPGLPAGLYWGIYVSGLVCPDEWKIDIWAMSSAQKETLQKDFDALKASVNEQNRPLILAIKDHYWRHPEYRKTFHSLDIYQAVIQENVRSVKEFAGWLEKNKGIAS
jgi:hypothetical protein